MWCLGKYPHVTGISLAQKAFKMILVTNKCVLRIFYAHMISESKGIWYAKIFFNVFLNIQLVVWGLFCTLCGKA